ncbi:hypothetical protein BKA70DRAFT_1235304 [Coprinopsis sp. MPI-PUGE-AT-0042]|nr:hypothetical protein BKA70DRAFT_1235304 [Coprinopsis sp. MPI-PUGE-AT-0042]
MGGGAPCDEASGGLRVPCLLRELHFLVVSRNLERTSDQDFPRHPDPWVSWVRWGGEGTDFVAPSSRRKREGWLGEGGGATPAGDKGGIKVELEDGAGGRGACPDEESFSHACRPPNEKGLANDDKEETAYQIRLEELDDSTSSFMKRLQLTLLFVQEPGTRLDVGLDSIAQGNGSTLAELRIDAMHCTPKIPRKWTVCKPSFWESENAPKPVGPFNSLSRRLSASQSLYPVSVRQVEWNQNLDNACAVESRWARVGKDSKPLPAAEDANHIRNQAKCGEVAKEGQSAYGGRKRVQVQLSGAFPALDFVADGSADSRIAEGWQEVREHLRDNSDWANATVGDEAGELAQREAQRRLSDTRSRLTWKTALGGQRVGHDRKQRAKAIKGRNAQEPVDLFTPLSKTLGG